MDVIVSELIGKAVLGQAMAEITGWCRDRFLAPGGRMIPERVDLRVAPVETSEAYSRTRLPAGDIWGIDFSPFQRHSSSTPISARVPSSSLLAASRIAYSYRAMSSPPVDIFDASLAFCAERGGVLHALAAWFSSVLAEGVELSNDAGETDSWDHLVFPLQEPVPITAGTTITVRLRGRGGGQTPLVWVWDTAVRRDGETLAEYRQSTFSSQMLFRQKPGQIN